MLKQKSLEAEEMDRKTNSLLEFDNLIHSNQKQAKASFQQSQLKRNNFFMYVTCFT